MSDVVRWLREQASGPMTQNQEHVDTCNMLTAAANELEGLRSFKEKDLPYWKKKYADVCRERNELRAIVARMTRDAQWAGFNTAEFAINPCLWKLPHCDGRDGKTLLEAAEAAAKEDFTG